MSEESLKKLEEELTIVPYERGYQNGSQVRQVETVVGEDVDFLSSSVLTEKEARDIIRSELFFTKISQKIQEKLQIIKISHSYVHTYDLQTWVEKRQLFWQFKKYLFGRIDDQSFGLMPNAWNIPVPDPDKIKPFCEHEENVTVKHSEYIQPCFNCSNLIQTECEVCGGNKKLVYFLKCKISWHNYKDEFTTEPHFVPFNRLKQASGETVYDVEDKKVNPIKYLENEEISKASEKYHKLHIKNSKKEKVLMQKQSVKKIEVFTIHYSYKNKVKKIYVYGDKKHREVFVPYSLNAPSTASYFLACIFLCFNF